MDYDLIVIGSGPGGYVAAIRASQLGMKVACVERENLGGVCLNWGCIPSKALLKSAEYANLLGHIGDYGLDLEGGFSVDYPRVIRRSRKVADKSEKGVRYLFKKYKVTAVYGDAKLLAADRVQITDADGGISELTAGRIIVATGARARWFPGMEPDGERVFTYREAIVSERMPASAIVLGAGAIGMEFAYFWNAMGVKVTLVEGADRIAPLEDAELSAVVQRDFTKSGMEIVTGAFASSVVPDGEGAKVTLADGRELTADVALLALGVRANIEDLGLEEIGVRVERGFIQTDADCRTSVPGVYAIGDVAGPPMLAHKASFEAHVCVERMNGHAVPALDPDLIPAGTFCNPQIASVGLTEAQAADQGLAFKVGRFPFAANGKNRGTGETEGLVKVIIGERYGELLGAHIVGANATELLSELVLYKTGELDAETFLHSIHSHPTSSEAVMEAVAEALGVSVHI